MCLQCVTGAEAAIGSAIGGYAMTRAWWAGRRRARLSPDERARLAAESWDGNAALMSSMGHDPIRILGPRPHVDEPTALTNTSR
jgi:hypothetical protein